MEKKRAPRNRTITISGKELEAYKKNLVFADGKMQLAKILNKTICANLFDMLDKFPKSFADLLIIDPPYNLNKNFNGLKFFETDDAQYLNYLESWFSKTISLLKPNGSVYLCGDWKCTASLHLIMKKYVKVQNRIIWQREKGRGAKANLKNASEDIWFGTMGNDYYFDVEAVKLKRKVLAPYKENGKPKDWEETKNGNFRLTYPSNFWDDISIPYWSMPENTDHPTQKPEKLIAKLILASCPEGGIVVDPFLGSGTTSVVAKKLNRNFIGVEMNEEYCCLAEKRLAMANFDKAIQGYAGGVFWE
ncbi:MAG: site-specific DNA-methyltransferase, partial [Fibromonadales bacterium]|nr:site-specific DNA-methyltransferase [Fibromonadales bacterium]